MLRLAQVVHVFSLESYRSTAPVQCGLIQPPMAYACTVARKVSDWPKSYKLALHAFLWEHSYKGLKLAQLLGQLGVFFT